MSDNENRKNEISHSDYFFRRHYPSTNIVNQRRPVETAYTSPASNYPTYKANSTNNNINSSSGISSSYGQISSPYFHDNYEEDEVEEAYFEDFINTENSYIHQNKITGYNEVEYTDGVSEKISSATHINNSVELVARPCHPWNVSYANRLTTFRGNVDHTEEIVFYKVKNFFF